MVRGAGAAEAAPLAEAISEKEADMKRSKWRWVLGAVAVLVLLGVAGGLNRAKDTSAGTGYSAWELCTRTLQSGQSLDLVRTRYVETKVAPLPTIWQLDVGAAAVTVRTLLPTLEHPRTAIFRKQLGCTLVPPGVDETKVRQQTLVPAPELPADARPWPFGEAEPESALASEPMRAAIAEHADRLFSEESDVLRKAKNTTALLVAHDGHLVYERYAQELSREQPQLGWSMTKTVTAMIAGVLERKGAIALDAPVGLERWQGTPKAGIKWRQLINMAPGLSWFEGYGGKSDATDMLFSQADQGLWAADRALSSEPGTVFTYSTGFTNIAMRRMRELLGGSHQAIYDLYQLELFAPLGIRHGVIEPDASGTPVGGARGLLRPVDWLRLGQLLANGGTWHGATILTPEYVSFMTAASPAASEYGGFIWREDSARIDPAHRAKLPDDMVWFAGHLGQFMLVIPSKKLVVLRMGISVGGTMAHDLARDQTFDLACALL
jgi:CubicO group peptidase (beta-lactamase class C family)